MLTISKPLSASQARNYHEREFASERQSYWSRDQQGFSEWRGQLAQQWGLQGPVGGDYNSETHKIAIHQRKTETAPEMRYVPLSDKGVAAYERLAARRKAGEPLVVNKFNRIGEAMGDIRWFDDVLIDAKITDELASWHVSRHTFCSRAVARGVPITDVKEYAGHSDLRTTSRYTHGIEGTSDVRNRAAMNSDRKPAMQPSVEDLQKQIEALTALVQRLTPGS